MSEALSAWEIGTATVWQIARTDAQRELARKVAKRMVVILIKDIVKIAAIAERVGGATRVCVEKKVRKGLTLRWE